MKHGLSFFLLVFFGIHSLNGQSTAKDLQGFYIDKDEPNTILLIQDGYFSVTSSRSEPAEFLYTLGGVCEMVGNKFQATLEFYSEDRSMVGESFSLPATFDGKTLKVDRPEGFQQVWIKQIESEQDIAGVWRISGRKVDGELREMPKRSRKTLKLLTNERFQWIAMNTETGEFSGTGGGKYIFKDGKYIEEILFFSRDNSRVGQKLQFDGKIEADDWHHSGKSSKGDPIYEIWSREN